MAANLGRVRSASCARQPGDDNQVTDRTYPIPTNIRSLVVWHGMRLAIVGVVLGIAAAFGLPASSRASSSASKPGIPLVFVTVPILLSLIALLAVWMPATHASRLDPQEALRIE
jgi:putative ABC transport system permease protein